jgi:GH25 family lysozyme M1 (1,4-beta-N-acetylmuramidase)
MPVVQPGFVVVGINGGKPFTDNSCLAREVSYARTRTGVSAYLNIDAPRSGDAASYGRKAALDGLARAQRAHLAVPVLWLDVEVLNHWSSSGAFNVAVINGALQALQQHGVKAGIYSSVAMWQQITGGARLDVPVWLATSVTDYRQLPQWCDTGLGGRPAEMTQYVAWDGHQLVDVDVLCQHAIPAVVGEFAAGAG